MAQISLDEARGKAQNFDNEGGYGTAKSRLVYVSVRKSTKLVLAYEFVVTESTSGNPLPFALVYVDAATGEVLTASALQHSAVNRSIHDANGTSSYPVTPTRAEGGAVTGIAAVDINYDHLGQVYNYYNSKFGRDSIDDASMPLKSIVNISFGGVPWSNAAWIGYGVNTMQYGSAGSGYNNWAISREVTGHELTHGVTENSSGLIYAYESGAINESISDIFGAAVDIYQTGTTGVSEWTIGEDIISGGIRRMDDPNPTGGTSSAYSKDHYSYILTLPPGTVPQSSNDYGYVHTNSGVSNLAFTLMVDGGTHPRAGAGSIPTTSVPAIGISQAEQVFYETNENYLGPGAQFEDLRSATVQVAQLLYGTTTATNVAIAWDVVGVPTSSNKNPVNISTLEYVGTGLQNLVAGFVFAGSGTDNVLIRAVGPTLTGYGVTGVLADPYLSLSSGGTNDDWSSAGNAASIASTSSAVGAFALPNPSKDAAILTTLGSGVYTATVSGVSSGTGKAIVEVYDASTGSGNPLYLQNISARAQVTATAKPTAGFVITGTGNKTILIRGIGPTLAAAPYYLTGTLADPYLKLFSGGTQLRWNNSWETNEADVDQSAWIEAARVSAGAFAAPNSSEACILTSLPAGSYTVELSGLSGGTGIGIVEVYVID